MAELVVRDSGEGLAATLQLLASKGSVAESRAGRVLRLREPFLLRVEEPWHPEISEQRDGNPFFHLLEGVYYLAGEDGTDLFAELLPRMRDFSDDGARLQGSYGERWRTRWGRDQIEDAVARLRTDPGTRRAAIVMWDAVSDWEDPTADVPCNLALALQLDEAGRLVLQTFNRSNDAILGLWGANCHHFPLLQRYVADRIGREPGEWWHCSANLHAYEAELVRHPGLMTDMLGGPVEQWRSGVQGERPRVRLVTHEPSWLDEACLWIHGWPQGVCARNRNPFFALVAEPMRQALRAHRVGDRERALALAADVYEPAWRQAATAWLARRYRARPEGASRGAQNEGGYPA